jgi:cbb3-type cytochrome oxidase subunit 1
MLAIYGVTYRLWPQLEAARLARLQFWLAALGVLLLILGTIQQVLTGSVVVVAIGAAVTIAGAGLLLYLFAMVTRRASSSSTRRGSRG